MPQKGIGVSVDRGVHWERWNPGLHVLAVFIITLMLLPYHLSARELSLNGRVVPPELVSWDKERARIDLNYLCEQVGAQYMYESQSQIIIVYKAGKTLQMQMNNSDVWVDQRFCRFSLPVTTRHGRVMVPFKDVALVLGGEPDFGKKIDYSFNHAGKRIICPGVAYDQYVVTLPSGLARAHVATIDLSQPELDLKAVLALEKMTGRETVSEMSQREGAVLAINASFFTARGNPLGMVVTNNQLVSVPIMSRSVFGWSRDRKVIFGNPRFEGTVCFDEDLEVTLDGVNQKPVDDESVILYTPEFGETTPVSGARKEVALLGTRVVAIGAGQLVIPPGGMVISATGERAKALENIEIWSPVEINYGLGRAWDEVQEAVGGGPRLVENGVVRITGSEEKFRNDVLRSRAPRSAIGITANRKLLLVAIDGRQPGYSIGMTLEELARFFLKLEAVDAMNLDGGGSTAMVVEGSVVNSPSDGRERPVGSALLICKRSSVRRSYAQNSGKFAYE